MFLLVFLFLITVPSAYPSNGIAQFKGHLTANGECGKGYSTTPFAGVCIPNCHAEPCKDNAICVAPNVCECVERYVLDPENNTCIPVCDEECQERKVCELGYYWTATTNSCVSICDEAYIWKSETASCEHRCKSDISWDVETQTCVQKLEANVELVVEEADKVLLNLAVDSTERADDGGVEGLIDLAFSAGTSNTTNCSAESKITICLSFISMLIVFAIVSLLMALGCFGNYMWKKHVLQQAEVLNAKTISQEEYMLDRSQIMVY